MGLSVRHILVPVGCFFGGGGGGFFFFFFFFFSGGGLSTFCFYVCFFQVALADMQA